LTVAPKGEKHKTKETKNKSNNQPVQHGIKNSTCIHWSREGASRETAINLYGIGAIGMSGDKQKTIRTTVYLVADCWKKQLMEKIIY